MTSAQDKKLKILFLISHCGQGGDWVVVKTTVRKLAGEAVECWLNGARWAVVEEPPEAGPIRLNRGWKEFFKVRKSSALLPRDLDIIHAHSPAAILTALLVRFWRAPKARIVFTFHWPTPDGFLRKQAKKWLFKQVARIHCPSIGIVDILTDTYGVPRSKCDLVYLGVESDRFKVLPRPEILRERRKIGWNEQNTVIGYLGRFDREKNVAWLIRFMREHRDQLPDLRLLVYGGGALKDELLEDAAEFIKMNRIHFAGYTRTPELAYPQMDLHVLPSSFEAFALTVVEAACCGVPTLRTNVEGAIDQIEDGVDGFLTDIKGGYPAFSRRLLEVLANHTGRLPEIGAASRVKLQQLCDMDQFGQGMLELYRRL